MFVHKSPFLFVEPHINYHPRAPVLAPLSLQDRLVESIGTWEISREKRAGANWHLSEPQPVQCVKRQVLNIRNGQKMSKVGDFISHGFKTSLGPWKCFTQPSRNVGIFSCSSRGNHGATSGQSSGQTNINRHQKNWWTIGSVGFPQVGVSLLKLNSDVRSHGKKVDVQWKMGSTKLNHPERSLQKKSSFNHFPILLGLFLGSSTWIANANFRSSKESFI